VLEQSLRVVHRQDIRYLFTTPAVLGPLLKKMHLDVKQAIRFIYLGGMAISEADLQLFHDHFPAADILCGYGNTLFGVCHQTPGDGICYYPSTDQHVVQVITMDGEVDDNQRLQRLVEYGETGQVVMHRFSESALLVNVVERDCGIRLVPNREGREGVANPRPCESKLFSVADGIY